MTKSIEMKEIRRDGSSATYAITDGRELTATIKLGYNGMVHHLFEEKKDAHDFLAWLKGDSPLSDRQKFDIKAHQVKVTETKNDPHHNAGEPNFYRVRVSPEQYKVLEEHNNRPYFSA